MSREGVINQEIIFHYVDKELEFWNALQADSEGELRKLKENMQGFLQEERTMVNGVRAEPKVLVVFTGFIRNRKHPFIRYIIRYSAFFKKGINTYVDEYEPVMSDYPYEVVWLFPEGTELLDVDVGVPYHVGPPNVLHFKVRRRTLLPGRERIVFHLP
ncbi:MAG: hypothetical protein J7L55_04700 [Desulfurococcales archaeon]|nr:hypothetical protein [Desulfurococcales archaeon]